MVQSRIFDQLSSHDQQVLQRIFDGTDLPPLYSDTIAKRVFDADVNDAVIAESTADDETLTRIRTEIRNMAQDKEVQNMLTQELFERMDWESYGEEREEEGLKQGRAEGMKQGRAEGMAKGENKLADLFIKLLSAGRVEDAKRASCDPIYRKRLYKELGIGD